MNLILTGMRGSGKTTLGRLLARELKKKFIDLDQEIEKKTGTNIATIVQKKGWNYFRQIEKKVCSKISKKKNCVIASGGGTILSHKNVEKLKSNGLIIFLECDLDILKSRLKKCQNRPNLKKGSSFIDELNAIWQERKTIYYQTADFVVKSENLESALNKLIQIIQNLK